MVLSGDAMRGWPGTRLAQPCLRGNPRPVVKPAVACRQGPSGGSAIDARPDALQVGPRSRGERALTRHRIAVLPGDGIGQEVIAAGTQVLEALAAREPGLELELQSFDWGSDYYRAHGRMMPEDGIAQLRGFDAIYFGAVGAPDIPDDVTLWGLRLAICQGFDQYANVRPARLLPGVTSPLRDVAPGELDWVVIRENTEGEYAGTGGRVHRGLPEEVGIETAVFTRAGCRRIMRFAFGLAQSRPRRHLTLVTKSNAQRHGMVLWDEVFAETARGLSRRHHRQGAGRRHDHAHGAQAAEHRCGGGDQPACRHPERPGERAHRLAGGGADRQPRSRAALPLDVRADPRLGLRHHRQGHRQPDRLVLERVPDARPSGRAGGRRAA